MCGIVGAVASGERNVVPWLVEGLKRLEYRGYDSCGLAYAREGSITRLRSIARVADLARQSQEEGCTSTSGIAHTRWATHGKPDTANAHPHVSGALLALVHNGIIENFESLRDELTREGYVFTSQTDTEVVAHLLHRAYVQGSAASTGTTGATEASTNAPGKLFAAMQAVVKRLRGAYALAAIAADQPHVIVGARFGSPLVAASGAQGFYLASDAMALQGEAERVCYLEEGDVAEITRTSLRIADCNGKLVERESKPLLLSADHVELGPYQHYMQKEIFEQPRAIADTMEGVEGVSSELFGAGAEAAFAACESVHILACGTSYYAGMVAKYWLESLARIPTQVEIASEYRYRNPVPNPRALTVCISQSGETADTLAALQLAHELGQTHTLAICNVASSALVREASLHYLTRAGKEIGVASTKAFTTQLVALFLLTLTLAQQRGRLEPAAHKQHIQALRHLPVALGSVLALEPSIMAWAQAFAQKENALFLGRGPHYPIALEGALKLKEISYIHAEGYPAGELKHGPLALVTERMPVVAVAPNDALLEKLKSNLQEVRARGGELYVFADADSGITPAEGLHLIRLPEHHGPLSPILHVAPLQLLAYHTAVLRGADVDKPRNLAKSVTVE